MSARARSLLRSTCCSRVKDTAVRIPGCHWPPPAVAKQVNLNEFVCGVCEQLHSPDWPMAERANWGYAVAAIGRYAAMRQLLAALSIVGLVTYFVVRLLLGRDENGAIEGHTKSGFEWAKVTDPSPT